MTIQKKQLEPLLIALNYPITKFVQSRKRDRARRGIVAEYEIFQKERTDILNKFATKDGEGEVQLKDGNYEFTPENLPKAEKELTTLLDESIDIDIGVTDAELRDLIDNSTGTFTAGQTDILASFFEDKVKEDKPKKK